MRRSDDIIDLTRRGGARRRRCAVLTNGCIASIDKMIDYDRRREHESVVYLLGQSDGFVTLTASIVAPKASTTRGSFDVDSAAMARVIRQAANYGLQVVGQLHTHPGEAFHSYGDIEGARIRFDGYVSIVLPMFGRLLPSLKGAAVYHYRHESGFVELDPSDVRVIPEHLR